MTTAAPTGVISNIAVITVQVSDQEKALKFYTEVLGFEKHTDGMFDEGMRWLTVMPKGTTTEIALTAPGMDAGPVLGKETGIIFATNDIRAAYKELVARGVKFLEEPSQAPWGWWCRFVDQDGNGFGFHQELDATQE